MEAKDFRNAVTKYVKTITDVTKKIVGKNADK